MQYEATAPIDPVQFAYSRYMQGREIDQIKYARMVKRFVLHRETTIISQICEKLGVIAVSSRVLTRRQRIKYADSRFTAGRSTFYLFQAGYVPADVGAKIDMIDGVHVYS